MAKTCDISGLPIYQEPEWRHVDLDAGYWAEYYIVGRQFLVSIAHGKLSVAGVRFAREYEKGIRTGRLDPEAIYLIDVANLNTFDLDGREEHRKWIADLTDFQAIIYYGASRFLRMAIHVAKRFHMVDRVEFVEENYAMAMQKGLWLTRTSFLRSQFASLRNNGWNQQDKVVVRGEQGIITMTHLGGVLFSSHSQGNIDVGMAEAIIREAERIVQLSGRIHPNIIILQDVKNVTDLNLGARKALIEGFKRVHHRSPILELVSYGASFWLQMVIKVSGMMLPFPVSSRSNEANAIEQAEKILLREYPRSKVKRSESLARTDQFVEYISSIQWEQPGSLQIPDSIEPDDPMRLLFESFVVVKRDVDGLFQQRALLLNEARELAAKAEAGTKAKSEFLAMMSHELRTPLNGVIGMTDVLLTGEMHEVQRKQTESIRTSGEQMLTLINDLLDLSRIDAGKFVLEPRNFKVQQIVERNVDLWKVQCDAKGLQFIMELDGHFPTPLYGDSHRLLQIFSNLIGNAIKFTEQGRVVFHLGCELLPNQQCKLLIEVADTGIGIPTNRIPLLFQKFQQLNAGMNRRYGGSGLGLAISKELAEMMNGGIRVVSEEGVGSRFYCHVQVGTGHITKSTPIMDISEVKAKSESNPLRILVVEDNPINQKVVFSMLKTFGITPALAQNGQEAVQKVDEQTFDLVFMDCQMPIMDGYEATQKIRSGSAGEVNKNVLIVAMTANAMVGDRERCVASGMDEYLSKPLTRQTLESMLHQCSRILKDRK